jgi:hypothetical protein
MKLRGLVLAVALLTMPSLALADPITVNPGTWTSTSSPLTDSEGGLLSAPFWSGLSWDGTYYGIGYMIDAYNLPAIEYLHDGSGRAVNFRFDADDEISTPSYFGGITAWTHGTFGRRADGAFTYDTGTGFSYNSWDNGSQFALFRLVGPEFTRYFLGIEDIPVRFAVNDHDHNDYITTFTERRAGVPEPTSLMLMGLGALGLVVRKRKQ